MQQRIFNEDKNKYYAASAALPGISLYFKAKLFEFFDYDIEAFWKCDSPDLKEFSLKNPDVRVSRTFLSAKSKINPELEYKNALEKGYKILGYEDENYPLARVMYNLGLGKIKSSQDVANDFSHTKLKANYIQTPPVFTKD